MRPCPGKLGHVVSDPGTGCCVTEIWFFSGMICVGYEPCMVTTVMKLAATPENARGTIRSVEVRTILEEDLVSLVFNPSYYI